MKKCLTIVSAFMLFMSAGNVATAQAVEEGNVIVDAYYGFPNLYSTTFRAAYANSGTETDVSIKGMGPLGGRVEYMLADKFGLGLDIGFNNTKLTFKDQVQEYNSSTGTYQTKVYDYNYTTAKFGAMITMNYHFLDNDNLDLYGQLGIGYGRRTYKFSSTDPNYSNESIKGLIPIASRLGVGMRYFFTDNVGVNLNLGFGQGGLANAGVSFKF
jgi:opacity protein-like surface antigen